MRGLFVTGTDTGAGKSVLAAAITAALTARGQPVRALKPVITGLDQPPHPRWPHDHELLALASGRPSAEVALLQFDPPVSPHLAGELSGRGIDPGALIAAIRKTIAPEEMVIVEGVGGLLVPLTAEGYSVRDLAAELGLPVVVAARPGLGTINHTLLTLEAARRVSLVVAGVVLTPWPAQPSAIERSNRATIELLGSVPVTTLPPLPGADRRLLARAGEELPLERWFATVAR